LREGSSVSIRVPDGTDAEEGSPVSIRVPDGTEVRADAVRIPDVRHQLLDQLPDHPTVREVITNGTDDPGTVRVAAFNSAI
jgi:hypothetical protein